MNAAYAVQEEKRSGGAMAKAVLAGSVGNALEWFDYGLYGYFASIISSQFFSSKDPVTALMLSFIVFGVGFVMLSRTIRMHRVRRMIQNKREQRSIASLAQEYGFTHLGRFSVQYRQMFGISPSSSRKAMAG